MNRRWIPWLVAAALVAAGATWWWELGRPQREAFELADSLSGRRAQRVLGNPGFWGEAERLLLLVRGQSPANDTVDQLNRSIEELARLAKSDPGALARAASVEPDPDTRDALVRAIRESDAYRSLPLDARLHEIFFHDFALLDASMQVSAPEADALKQGGAPVVEQLHEALRAGHCGALAALSAIGDAPIPGELGDAMVAPTPPGGELPIPDRCRDAFQTALRARRP